MNCFAAPQTQPVTLELAKPIERSIAADETQSYVLNLNAGQYAHIVVDQRGADVVLTVFGPDGGKIVRVDSPNGIYGCEPIFLVADTAGAYRIEVHSTSNNSGRYEVKLEEMRAMTERDRDRMKGQKLFEEAKALRNQRTRESYQQATEKYQAALTLWRTLDEKLMQAFTLHEVGMIYGDVGLYQKALDSHAAAAALYKELKLPRDEAGVLTNIGWVFGELGDTEHRLEMYDRAAETYKTIGDVDSVLISNFGSTYAKLGEYQRALDIHQRVLEMRRASRDFGGQAITLNNIGDCYEHLGDKAKALDFYNKSLALMPQVHNDFYTANVLIHLGNVYRSLGQYDKSFDYLTQTLMLRRTMGDQRGVAMTLFHLAGLERDRGNLGEARKRVEEALTLVEWLRTKVTSQQLRASFFASVQQFREFYIDLLLRLHKENPSQQLDRLAFNASETGRARSLLELLNETNTEIHHGVDPALLQRKSSLGQEIADKAESQMRLLAGKHTEDEANAILKEITALTSEYEQVEAQIRDSSPQYAALVQPAPLKLEETQRRVLDADTLLLEYSLGEEKSFLWTVTPDTFHTYELPNR
ncbi:MAG TPA: tetratricopeptide repeat protein, partial [Pyrinomonadaceae bacterium]|nr:tetratricopeptide repeat protein [Pyrinomonadaceae bacterium]